MKKYLLTVLSLVVLFSASMAEAKQLENGQNDRKGFLIGLGAGVGFLDLNYVGFNENKAAFVGDVKIGGGITEDILLMYDGSVVDTQINGTDVMIYNFPVAVQWFFADNFYVRPGIGLSIATASQNFSGTTVSITSQTSFGVDFAAGYEFRFGRYFALSPEIVYHYSYIRDSTYGNGNANTVGGQASLLWYF
jgi:hypothetical protein